MHNPAWCPVNRGAFGPVNCDDADLRNVKFFIATFCQLKGEVLNWYSLIHFPGNTCYYCWHSPLPPLYLVCTFLLWQILIYEGSKICKGYDFLRLVLDLRKRNWNTTLLQNKGITVIPRGKIRICMKIRVEVSNLTGFCFWLMNK